jgi:hypothetical protein
MAVKKENRCWPGYEPVKNKKPNSQGSCRPKAESKLTTSQKSFRTKRRRQLDEWESKHPRTRKSAAQHLGAPGEQQKASSRTTKSKSSPRKKSATSSQKRAKKKS